MQKKSDTLMVFEEKTLAIVCFELMPSGCFPLKHLFDFIRALVLLKWYVDC